MKHNFFYKILRFGYHHVYVPVSLYIIKIIYKNKPIQKNKIVIDNFSGRGMGDNPKYIVEALMKEDKNLDIVWEISDKNIIMPIGIRRVKYHTPQALRELLTAKVWIDNVKNSFKPDKRKGQFYLQTWHAGLGLKASERQVQNNLSPEYVANSKRDASMTDLMLSDSEWTTSIYKNWFWYNGPIEKTGFPRNDILVNQSASISEKVRKYFELSKDIDIVLYAPTFRDNNLNLNIYKFNFLKVIAALNNKFESNYVVLIRLHPNIADYMDKSNLYKFDSRIKNASLYPDMQELIVACDSLITDYSSCMFDAMIAKKKVFLLAKDLYNFEKKDRNLLFNIKSDLPFSFSKNEEEIVKNINLFNNINYKCSVDNFMKKVGLYEDGHAAERVAHIILQQINNENVEERG